MKYNDIISCLNKLANPEIAQHSQRYFKTGKGEYGYGDKFLGIRVPILRKHVKLFQDTKISNVEKLLKSKYHEVRMISLLLMVRKFSKGGIEEQEQIFNLYLLHTKYINNWDLVDSSAPYIVGPWLYDKDRSVLYDLAYSKMLWERRISIMSTAFFIKNGQYSDTLKISNILLGDPEDLIQKAVGWMLREVGNRDRNEEEKYLKKQYKKMPRTMLRYAIEKFEQERRQLYLKGLI